MARGRLVFPLVAELFRLDTVATALPTQDGQPSGFDSDYREPVKVPTPNGAGGPGTNARQELPALRVPCQVEVPKLDQLHQAYSGAMQDGQLLLVFHFRDLERLELVEELTGKPLFNYGDRLGGVYDPHSGKVVHLLENPLYATRIEASSFGLTSRKRNLLLVTFDRRDRAVR